MSLCIVLACFLSPVEEVVVTASLRREPLEELPASVVVLEERTLERAGVQHFQDVLHLVPNLNWSAGTSRPRYFQLRGIGELEQYQGAPNPSVGFLIDDIDFSGIGMPATLFDVQQIEVLRGPQGTLYGANALAGLVSVRTRAPSAEHELEIEATNGEHSARSAGAMIGGPLGQGSTAAFRLVGQRYRSDGFRRNFFLGRDDTNDFDETTGRAKLRWLPREDLQLDLTAVFADLDNGYDAFAVDNGRVTRSDRPGRDAQRSRGFAARLEHSGFERVVLQSITTVADSDIVYSFDGDWGNDRDWGIFAPYDFSSRFLRDRRTWSQELRAVSAPGRGAGGRADWVFGLYTLGARETNDQLDLFNGELFRALDSRYEAQSTAAYGQVDLPIGARAALTFGARIEHRGAEYEDSDGSRFAPDETHAGGHMALRRELAAGHSAYFSVASGYKAGGFNVGLQIPEDRREFGAERLTSYELGWRTARAERRWRAQAALFYMRRTDQQVNTSFQLDPGDPLSYVFFTDNAARGENYGIETEWTWRAGSRLELSASGALLETSYIGYRFGERDLDGREQAHAPEYQYALAAQYRDPRGWLARLDVQGMDDFYFDASHDQRSDPFRLVNLRVGYESERWTAYLWARNVFDEDYAMRGFEFGLEPQGDPAAPTYPAKRYVQPGDPRQLGVTVRYAFR
jgi:outer membrane receptor protein involved in Fe transport